MLAVIIKIILVTMPVFVFLHLKELVELHWVPINCRSRHDCWCWVLGQAVLVLILARAVGALLLKIVLIFLFIVPKLLAFLDPSTVVIECRGFFYFSN